MGRTIRTYRQRLNELRRKFVKISQGLVPHLPVERPWVAAHRLSAPGSTFPWPDTAMVVTMSMLLEFTKDIGDIERLLNHED